jgi:hypothetical protein
MQLAVVVCKRASGACRLEHRTPVPTLQHFGNVLVFPVRNIAGTSPVCC